MSERVIINGEYVTKWFMRIVVSICSFLIYQEYSSNSEDVHEIKSSLKNLEGRMIRIEYELKLK